MKKLMSLLLAAVMLLSFAACSGNGGGQTAEVTPEPTEAPTAEPTEEPIKTKEELLSSSDIEATMSELGKMTSENFAKAKLSFCGKVVVLTGFASSIEADYVKMESSSASVKIFIPLEDLVNIIKKHKITVVGIVDDEVEIKEEKSTSYIYSMKTAYYVTDTFEVTGKLWGERSYQTFSFSVPPTNTTSRPLTFASNVDVSNYQIGGRYYKATITVSCKSYLNEYYVECYYDAVPIG